MIANAEFDSGLYNDRGEPVRRFLPIAEVWVSDVELSEDASRLLVPDYRAYLDGEGRKTTISERCFLAFVNLAEAPPDKILGFARKWGMLGLCKHGEPAAGHGLRRRRIRPEKSGSTPLRCNVYASEALEDWRWFASQFRVVLELAAALRERRVSGTSGLWERLSIPSYSYVIGNEGQKRKRRLVGVVNTLLAASAIQPFVSWNKVPTLHFGCRGGTTLFAALTFELAMAVSRCRVAFCSYCHQGYEPLRRPRDGEANCCEDCKGRANAERVRRFRQRKRVRPERSRR